MNTMNTNLKRWIGTLGLVVCFTCVNQPLVEAAHVPAIIHVLLDASASVSEQDFRKANHIVAEFADLLYALSQDHPGERADWLSVNWFGGAARSQDYLGTKFINCSEILDMALLYGLLENMAHPKYEYTGIYSAIALATIEVLELDDALSGSYFRLIVVITDGEDNDSSDEVKTLVSQIYPNDEIALFVIGVGNKAEIREFEAITELVVRIDEFDDLLVELIGAREVLSVLEE